MGPTFVHANMRFDHVNDVEANDHFHDAKSGHGYASYNKPYSVHAFLEANTVEEEYIVMVDTDMFFLAPVDPASLGVRRGNVVSAEYTYLHGTTSGFADRFIPNRSSSRGSRRWAASTCSTARTSARSRRVFETGAGKRMRFERALGASVSLEDVSLQLEAEFACV